MVLLRRGASTPTRYAIRLRGDEQPGRPRLKADGRALFTAWLPGGAVGALSAAAQELVRTALGAPPAAPGFAWHDEPALKALFSRHGMNATVDSVHELVFTAVSPHVYLEAERTSHPLAVTGFEVLQQRGQADEAYAHLVKELTEHNEGPASLPLHQPLRRSRRPTRLISPR